MKNIKKVLFLFILLMSFSSVCNTDIYALENIYDFSSDFYKLDYFKNAIIKGKQKELNELELTPEEEQAIYNLKKDGITYYLNKRLIVEDEQYSYDIQYFYIELLEQLLGIDIKVVEPIDGVTPIGALDKGIADFTTIDSNVILPNMYYSSYPYAVEKVYKIGTKENILRDDSKKILVYEKNNGKSSVFERKENITSSIEFNNLSDMVIKFIDEKYDGNYVLLSDYNTALKIIDKFDFYVKEYETDIPVKFVSRDRMLMNIIRKVQNIVNDYDIYTLGRLFNNRKLQNVFLASLDEEEYDLLKNIGVIFSHTNLLHGASSEYLGYYKFLITLVNFAQSTITEESVEYDIFEDIVYLSDAQFELNVLYDDYEDDGLYKTLPLLEDKFDLFTINNEINIKNIYDTSELYLLKMGVLVSQQEGIEKYLYEKYGITEFDGITAYKSIDELIRALIDNDIDFVMGYPGLYYTVKYNAFKNYGIEIYNNNYILDTEKWYFSTSSEILVDILEKYLIITDSNISFEIDIIMSILKQNFLNDYKKDGVNGRVIIISIITSSILFYLLKKYDTKNLIEESKKYDAEQSFYNQEGLKDFLKNINIDYVALCINIENYKDLKIVYQNFEIEEISKIISLRLKTLSLNYKYDIFKISESEFYVIIKGITNINPAIEDEMNRFMAESLDVFNKKVIIDFKAYVISSVFINKDKISISKFKQCMIEIYAKENIEESILYFDDSMYRKLLKNININKILSEFKETEIRCYYQPIVNVKTGEIIACESFTKIEHGDKIYDACDYIENAGKVNIDNIIDEHLLNVLITKRGELLAEGIIKETFKFSLNVSENFMKKLNEDLLSKLCKYHKIESLDFIIFEIDPSILVMKNFKEKLQLTLDYKIELALDNRDKHIVKFSNISEVTIKTLKFNKDIFLDNTKTAKMFMAGLKAIDDIKIVCSCVETDDEYRRIKDSAIELYQGHYFAHPKTFDELVVYLKG